MNHFSHRGETYEAVSDRGTDCIDHVRHGSARTGVRKSLELSRLLCDASHPNREVRDPDESVPVRLQRARAKELNASLIVYNMVEYPDGKRSCVVATEQQLMMVPSPLELLFGSKAKRSPEGSEVVEGHPSKVEKVVVTRSDGTIIESRVWEAEDLKGVPVKIISKHPGVATFTAIYRDIVLGTPEKVLVSPPDKCTPYEQMWQTVEQHVYN